MNGVLVPWVIATTILMFVAAYWIYTLEKRLGEFSIRYENLLGISEALSEVPDQAALLPIVERLESQATGLNRTEARIDRLEQVLPHTVQGLGITRYNAFEGVGGDQSFSVALVDSRGRGAIITGLYTGEEIRVYAKPLENWKSSYSLSADEQRALAEARQVMQNGTSEQ
ncbi:MAG: DUF4446 family protein [Anaerolineae bacterium]